MECSRRSKSCEAMRASGHTPKRPIEIVAWMNEEGSRFTPGMMGSATFAGAVPLSEMLPIRDAKGVSVEQGITI